VCTAGCIVELIIMLKTSTFYLILFFFNLKLPNFGDAQAIPRKSDLNACAS
jgi:hypothetical protein